MAMPSAPPPSYSEAVTTEPLKYEKEGTANRGFSYPANDVPATAYVEPQIHTLDDVESTFGQSFSNKAIRRAFIRKVYLILMAQLTLTVGIICLFIFVNSIREWVKDNLWVYLTSYGIFLVVYFVLLCITSVRRTYPGNLICLLILTVSLSIVMATISCFHSTSIVLMAMAVTTIVCLSITIFAMQTKIDFTMCAGLMFTFWVVVFMFGFSCLITQFALARPIPILSNVYAALIALLFAWFLIYDTQLIMGGKKYALNPEEYIFGALALYIDIVDLFLIILAIFGRSN